MTRCRYCTLPAEVWQAGQGWLCRTHDFETSAEGMK